MSGGVSEQRAGVGREGFRAVQGLVGEADDARLARIVAMVDGLAERGAADRLLEPLRPRLAQLRPPRPLRFARLLFSPMDPLIVPPARWRVGGPSVPRSVLAVLANAVQAALGPVAAELAVAISGRSTAEEEVVASTGAVLWPRAAVLLEKMPAPDDWAETGLPPGLFAPIARNVAMLLRPAREIGEICAARARGLELDEAAVERVLNAAAMRGPEDWRAVSALLLLRLDDSGPLLRAMTAGSRQGDVASRTAFSQAVDAVLGRVENIATAAGLLGARDAAAAAAEMERIAELLDRLEERVAGPERRQRIGQIRARADTACRGWLDSQFGDMLDSGGPHIRAALAAADDTAVVALEAALRGLRGVEAIGRRFGAGERYDRMLETARARVAGLPGGGGLDLVDRARLLELLAGADEAEALLRG